MYRSIKNPAAATTNTKIDLAPTKTETSSGKRYVCFSGFATTIYDTPTPAAGSKAQKKSPPTRKYKKTARQHADVWPSAIP